MSAENHTSPPSERADPQHPSLTRTSTLSVLPEPFSETQNGKAKHPCLDSGATIEANTTVTGEDYKRRLSSTAASPGPSISARNGGTEEGHKADGADREMNIPRVQVQYNESELEGPEQRPVIDTDGNMNGKCPPVQDGQLEGDERLTDIRQVPQELVAGLFHKRYLKGSGSR